jgi:hypothetical protein
MPEYWSKGVLDTFPLLYLVNNALIRPRFYDDLNSFYIIGPYVLGKYDLHYSRIQWYQAMNAFSASDTIGI